MNPIDKILEAFARWKNHTRPCPGHCEWSKLGVDTDEDFIRTSFASYNKELREKVAGMKPPFADGTQESVKARIVLNKVLALLK